MVQQVQVNDNQEPGRNDLCPCGSKKKYKKCCLKKKEFVGSKVDLETMLKLLYCLVRGLKGQSIIITKRTVDEKVPDDWAEKMDIQTGITNGIELYGISIRPDEKKSDILTAPKRILLPGDN